LLCLILLPSGLNAAQTQAITVRALAAGVEMKTADGTWQTVDAARELPAGASVRTGAGRTGAEILLPDGSKIVLGPNSNFTVEQADHEQSVFNLATGKLRAAVSGFFSSRIQIKTPTAVCSVRGTVFDMSADNKNTEVSMAEGLLEVKDSQGKEAVVSSEESIKIGAEGMEKPQLIGLSDRRAQEAVRPMSVLRETNRDQTRAMMEDLRNRELKANEAQLGKSVVDAFGHRVRLEEYLLRPTRSEFKLIFMSFRENRFDWGHLIERFQNPIPDDLSQVPAIVANTYLSRTMPANYLKYFEVYLTNTIDGIREAITLTAPVKIDFQGYTSLGSPDYRYYPASIDYVQTLSGPGVPGGSRVQFQLTQDWNSTWPGQFAWNQKVIRNDGTLDTLVHVTLDPTSVADVNTGYTNILGDDKVGDATIDTDLNPNTQSGLSYPSGRNRADIFAQTGYWDGSIVSTEKFLVSNDGKILDFSNPTADSFTTPGNYNLEIVAKSNLFQGRKIDVLMAPEILAQKKSGTTTPDALQP
jgi:hypothetical protein